MHTFVDSVVDELVYCIINVIMKKKLASKTLQNLDKFYLIASSDGVFPRKNGHLGFSSSLTNKHRNKCISANQSWKLDLLDQIKLIFQLF